MKVTIPPAKKNLTTLTNVEGAFCSGEVFSASGAGELVKVRGIIDEDHCLGLLKNNI